MYEEGVREVSRCWESLVQEQQRLQSVHLRYRNYKAVLHRNNVVCGQFKVFVPLKEYDIPAECVDKLSTPLELVICFVIFLYRIDILHCFTFD